MNDKITFCQLETMLDKQGIVGVVKDRTKPFFNFGFRGGLYLGAPGKDISFILPHISDNEKDEIAAMLARLYPKKPPSNHVKWAACIRYIYGCFEKQGCLRSVKDKKRMVGENTDWSLPIDFMSRVACCFEDNKNRYGLVIHYEMLAHRHGDRAIIDNDKSYLISMMQYYERSSKLASQIKCWKQMFTPFYWAAGYYKEIGEKRKSLDCYNKCIKRMEKYCPDAREGYREKVRTALKIIKKYSTNDDWRKFRRWYKKCRNKCLLKVKI